MEQKNPEYRKRCGNEVFWLNALAPMSALGLQFSCMRMSRSREPKGVQERGIRRGLGEGYELLRSGELAMDIG